MHWRGESESSLWNRYTPHPTFLRREPSISESPLTQCRRSTEDLERSCVGHLAFLSSSDVLTGPSDL